MQKGNGKLDFKVQYKKGLSLEVTISVNVLNYF